MSPPTTPFFAALRLRHHHPNQLRLLSTTHSRPIEYPLSHPIYTIWAANTSLGKPLVSAGLSTSFLSSSHRKFLYLKPLQTGFPNDSDSRFVYTSNNVLKASVSASEAVLRGEFEVDRGENVSNGNGVLKRSDLLFQNRHVFASSNVLKEPFSGLERPFRFPAILVGDGRLGGISGTISAYESLKLRGYDVDAVVFEDYGLVNEGPLSSYLQKRVPVLVLPSIPKEMSNNLMEWFQEALSTFHSLDEIMQSAFLERTSRLRNMPRKARDTFWWPFTQHKLVPEENVTVIDSRCGENFAVHKINYNVDLITQQFDACASWWTQGPDAALQIELARDMGYATARYGHVMFPENVYDPALECAELLLEGVGKGWASRVHFSDNGSTAIEIALKMALWKFLFDHKIVSDDLVDENAESCIDLKAFSLHDNIFKESRDTSNLVDIYHSYVWQILQLNIDSSGSTRTGALIIEPVIQGAGGMEMVDPLFQRVLSATEFIHCKPDIACFAKLMTGGIVPLAVTLASEAVFDAFVGDSKLQALLHGHSYTAHAVGCTAAVKSIKWFKDSKTNRNLISEAMLLRELWDPDMVRRISLLPAVHRVVVLGTMYASLYATSLLQKLREDGIFMRPLGNVIYLMCGPCTSPESCSNLLNKV
ncbi:unnamed protein product [Withania somnifera]